MRKLLLAVATLSALAAPAAASAPAGLVLLVHLDGYASGERADADLAALKAALDEAPPFSRYAAAIDWRTLPPLKGRACSLRKAGGKALLACAPALLAQVNAQGAERFKLIVLSNEEFTPNAKVARGKNSALYLSARNPSMTDDERRDWLGRMFLHELGHAFGLRDEYGRERPESGVADAEAAAEPSRSAAYRPAPPNCAPDLATAQAWWGKDVGTEDVGFYRGCAGRMEYVRPSEGKLMSSFAKERRYGAVSERYLDSVLRCFYLEESSERCAAFRAGYPKFWSE